MAELGVKCSRGYIPHDECRQCALNPLHPCGLTADLLELMRSENSGEPDANTFTPSRLLNVCDRQRVLQNGNDHYLDIGYAWATMRGHAIHALLEKSGRYPGLLECVREVRLETTIEAPDGSTSGSVSAIGTFDPAIFKGKSDFIGLLRQDGGTVYCKIADYKTTKYIKAGFTDVASDPYTQKHLIQINMYRWLVERALPKVLGRDVKVVVEELELLYLDMERTVRFTSVGDITYGKKTYKAIPMLPLDKVEKFIIAKIKQKRRADKILPPVLDDFPTYWACERCPVKKVCVDIERQEHEQSYDS